MICPPLKTEKARNAAGLLPALGILISSCLLSIAGPVLGDAPNADSRKAERLEIVDRAIEYHGGALFGASETELDICSRSGCFHVRARVEGDLYEYDVSGKVRDRERRVRVTNTTLERWEDGTPVVIEPEQSQALRDWAMARVYFCFLPYRLNDPSVYKEDLGIVDWRGRRLHTVKVTFEPGSSTDSGDEYLYWFDPETGRLEQFAYSFDTGSPGLRFRKPLDYRVVGGLLFFDQENFGVEGELSVDAITPEYVEESMSLLSTVRLRNIEVRPVEARPTKVRDRDRSAGL